MTGVVTVDTGDTVVDVTPSSTSVVQVVAGIVTATGGRVWNKVTVTSNYTASDGDWVFANAASADLTVAFPTTLGADVLVTRIDDASGGHTVTLAAVDGGTETLGALYQSFLMRGDGTIVRVVGERRPFGTPGRLGGPVSAGTSARTLRADAVFDTKIIRNPQTGTSYTLVLADANNKVVECDNASPFTLTVPPASSVAWVDGTTIEWYQKGVGQVTITAGAGVTLRARNGAKSAGQLASGGLRYRGGDEWVVSGDTTT